MSKTILYLAYFYPPLGGPGVQRPIKTIKYLKQQGFTIDVLTVENIQFHSYDYELLEESKADNIYRTNSLDLMAIIRKNKKTASNNLYFNTPEKIKRIIRGLFPIDDKIGWFPFAYKKAKQLISNKQYDFIIATIGPYTTGLLAYYLHKKTKIPYYIDYRDHWTLHAYPQYNNKLLLWHAKKCEKKMLSMASGIFVISNLMKEMMINEFGSHLKDITNVVYNGFDEDDFTQEITKPETGNIYIRYVGNLYGNRNANYFIKAIEKMIDNNELPDNIIIEFIGNYYTETAKLLTADKVAKYIKIIPQVTHKKAVEYMRTADLLLLFIATKDRNDFVVGKVFEYIRANVPILNMIPINGEVAEILKELGHKHFCAMEDDEAIRKLLLDFINDPIAFKKDISYDKKYSREYQTMTVAAISDRHIP